VNLEKYERSMEHTAWPVTLQARFLASTYGSLIVKKKYHKNFSCAHAKFGSCDLEDCSRCVIPRRNLHAAEGFSMVMRSKQAALTPARTSQMGTQPSNGASHLQRRCDGDLQSAKV